jgi:hypothetical protein
MGCSWPCCAPGVVLGTQKDEVAEGIVEGEAEETLSLLLFSDLVPPLVPN